MKFEKLKIEGSWLASSKVHSDNRGHFIEWFKFDEITETTNIKFEVRQANSSFSNKGVLRGIHYSLAKIGQSKWVTCAAGSVLDFVVDIRPDSPTYKSYDCNKLMAGDGKAILIGAGLGHAFLSLEDGSVVSYLLSSSYSPSEEFEINPMDPELNIDWQKNLISKIEMVTSSKDAKAPSIAERLEQNQLPYLFK